MRKLLTAFLAMGMLMSSFMAVSAQDAVESAPSSVVGLDTPATWTDERGNQVATVSVQGIDPEFSDHSEYSTPERGYIFVAVDFTITNISGSSMIVEPYDFSLLDAQGRNNGRAYVSQDEGAEIALFEDDLALAADEAAELTLVFQMPAEVAASAFIWQPDSGILVTIDVSDGAGEGTAVASGLNAPVTWTDDRGNPVATLEITNVEEGWSDFDEYNEPERGTQYIAVDITVTNVSDSNLILEPYGLSLIDNTGLNNGRAYASAVEGADPVLTDDTPIAAGETFQGTVVFNLLLDMTPSAFMWQPDSGLIHLINLNDVAGTEGEATPTNATPEADASPAADAAEEDTAAANLTEATQDESEEEGEPASAAAVTTASTPEGDTASASASASGTVTEVNGDPVVFNDVVDEENGEIRVISTQDGWDGFADSNAPTEGTRFFLVTVEVTPTNGQELPMSPLDFTVNTESGGAYDSDLYLNADDAEVKVTDRGGMLAADEPTTLIIPFMVPNDEVPVSISWNTGQDEVELELVP